MLTLSQLQNSLIYKFSSESDLTKAIEEVSQKFTFKRDQINDYLEDPRLVAAYACFYLTTNLPKLNEVLAKINVSTEYLDSFEFVDIGCGPGTFTLSLLDINPNLTIHSLEKSPLMIDQAMKFVNELHPAAQVSIFDNYKRIPKKKKKRLGIFGHSANEMELNFITDLVEKLELDEVLFIEPGTKDYFNKSLVIRDSLLNSGFNMNFPCPSSGTCPMSKDDWCHQYIKVTHEPDVERLTQLVSKDRRLLPLTIHYYSKEQVSIGEVNRLVRVYRPTKFSTEWQVCRSADDGNELKDLQIMNRGHSKPEIKKMQQVLAGKNIEFNVDKEVSESKLRGTLK
jgi:ribosomal protein RSM22 (predicted rRNA methylase)